MSTYSPCTMKQWLIHKVPPPEGAPSRAQSQQPLRHRTLVIHALSSSSRKGSNPQNTRLFSEERPPSRPPAEMRASGGFRTYKPDSRSTSHAIFNRRYRSLQSS
jgi:hypothetical protein